MDAASTPSMPTDDSAPPPPETASVVSAVTGERPDNDADDNNDEAADEPCEPSFFEEEAACIALLARAGALLPPTNDDLLPSVGADPQGVAAMLEVRLPAMVDRYQDSPHLLLPYLEALMGPLVALLLRYLPNAAEVWARSEEKAAELGSAPAHPSSSAPAATPSSPNADGAPSLVVTGNLGQDLSMFDPDAPKTPLHVVCKALCSIIKTAGEKCCTSHFPNNVSHYEDVFYTLQLWVADPTRQREWEVRYCLLLWLSNLVLVPFSLSLVDSQEASNDAVARRSLSDSTLITASRFLTDTSKCREAAALLVARLLTRPDSARHRRLFFDFAAFTLESAVAASSPSSTGGTAQQRRVPQDAAWFFLVEGTSTAFESRLSQPFLLPGVLLAIAKTMKLGRREELSAFAPTLLATVSAVYDRHPGDSLLCKTAVKVGQRLVLVMLKKRRAGWRYRRHIASLTDNLAAVGVAAPSPVVTAAAAAGAAGDARENEEEEDVLEGDDESLETGISLLLQAIGHKDTIVRWSAAKGVGRVCERLPAAFAAEVMEAVLEAFSNANSDTHWHGGLLTIAELCRRSLVGTTLLARVVPLVAQGLAYDLSKGTYSVGAHVRDAACYTCWSIARAYDADDLTEHVRQLSVSLIVTALFDREVNVRRAAAAAFQECVGRLGSFEHGIELVTTVDFFSLATLRHAYTVVAPAIACYDTYRDGMLRELVAVKLLHWDKMVRHTAAVALGRVAVQEPAETVVAEVLPELLRRVDDVTVATRHGAILAVAELVRSLPPSTWTPAHIQQFVHILTSLESSRGFRSRGGEYVRQACCTLLQAIAARRLPLPDTVDVTRVNGRTAKVRTLEVVFSFLRDTWVNILEWVQLAATDTFAAVAAAYFSAFLPSFHGKVLTELLEGCAADQPPMRRRGFLAAVGGLPPSLLNAVWGEAGKEGSKAYESFVPVLQSASLLSAADLANPELADAEGRRNAARSLSRVLVHVDPASPAMTPAWFTEVVEGTLLVALQDYAADKRGDVGSFVRLAVLEGLPAVVQYGLRAAPQVEGDEAKPRLCTAATGLSVLRGVVRCLLEKLDRVRAAAGSALTTLLLDHRCADVLWGESMADDAAVQAEVRAFTEHLAALVRGAEAAEAGGPVEPIDWHNTQQVMRLVAPFVLTQCPTSIAPAALEGLVVAAGDLSEHVRRPATAALLSAFHNPDDAGVGAARLSACLVDVLSAHAHEERMLKPACRVLDLLINESAFAVEQHSAVLDMLRRELRHFALNIIVLLAMVPLLANLCRSPDVVVRRGAWSLALTMIASRYPKVRAKVATDLYTSLLVLTSGGVALAGVPMEGCTKAMEHLASVTWDGNDAARVRASRNALYGMLEIDPPVAREKTEKEDAAAAARPARESRGAVAATYKSLVQETGY